MEPTVDANKRVGSGFDPLEEEEELNSTQDEAEERSKMHPPPMGVKPGNKRTFADSLDSDSDTNDTNLKPKPLVEVPEIGID